MVRPIRQAHSPEALEGQAHHPEQGRRTDGVSKEETWQLSPLVEHGDSNPVFDITRFNLFALLLCLVVGKIGFEMSKTFQESGP